MITVKKILTLKPRVQLRKAADIFHEASVTAFDEGYLQDVLSVVLSSGLVDGDTASRISEYYKRHDSVGYDDIHYALLSLLGDVPAEWDAEKGDGSIDWSGRKTLPHMLFLDHLRSPYNVGSIFRNAEAFGVSEIVIAPGTASPLHPRALRTSRSTVEAIPWKEGGLETIAPDMPVFALETGGTDIREFEFPAEGVCIVGSEETGITPEARARALASLGLVTIPQLGAKGSMNVASATAVILYKWMEQRDKVFHQQFQLH